MFRLNFHSHFLQKAKKLTKQNPKLYSLIAQVMHLLEKDPFTPSLKTHKVLAKYDGKVAYSSQVTKDLRIVWRFVDGEIRVIALIDIGGHSGGGKVYK